MQLNEILSITGKPGLYKILSSTNTKVITESLLDGKKLAVSGTQRISSLADITMFTYEEDIPLEEVFNKVFAHAKGEEAIHPKSKPEELRAYMTEVLPDFDEDRVYNSDLKKLFSWYNLLLKNDFFSEENVNARKKALEEAQAEEADAQKEE